MDKNNTKKKEKKKNEGTNILQNEVILGTLSLHKKLSLLSQAYSYLKKSIPHFPTHFPPPLPSPPSSPSRPPLSIEINSVQLGLL